MNTAAGVRTQGRFGPSIGQRMLDTGGRATGFDYLRIVLASGVIFWHAFTISYGQRYGDAFLSTPLRPLVALILPMFFALSGFLVAGSLERSRAISTFLGLRVIRIAPALGVEILLSALVLGPWLTSFTLTAYFADPSFAAYFRNMMGDMHYHLPGLFLGNPIGGIVNGQLWTVPWELNCYASLTVLAVLGVVRRRGLFLAVTLAGTVALFALSRLPGNGFMNQEHGVVGPALLFSFLAAVALYNFRDETPCNGCLAGASATALVALFLLPGGDYLVGFPAAYLTIYLGLQNPAKIALLKGADYSYGLYLYGYAIQQAVAHIGPWTHHWYVNFPMAMGIGALFAAFSWRVVEKPALGLRRFLPPLERAFARMRIFGGRTGAVPTPG
jgi:peptidoglycan/LPS O-acetylase OafA/YrhL